MALFFFQSLGIVALFNNISISVAMKRVVAPPSNFIISPGTPSGPTDLFLPIFAGLFYNNFSVNNKDFTRVD